VIEAIGGARAARALIGSAGTGKIREGRFFLWARYCQIHQDPARRELALQLGRALGLANLGPDLAPVQPPSAG